MNRRKFAKTAAAAVGSTLVPRAFGLASGPPSVIPAFPALPGEVAGIRLIDSAIASSAVKLAREVSPPYLFNHSARTFLFGRLVGQSRGLRVDEELLFLACIFHDLGLTDRFEGNRPFEIEGAIAAASFLRGHGLDEDKIETVWNGIAMHPLAISEFKRPEISLVAVGAGADVVGGYLELLGPKAVAAVVAAFPRLGFKTEFAKTCCGVAFRHPRGASRTFMRDIAERCSPKFRLPNICDSIDRAPFAE